MPRLKVIDPATSEGVIKELFEGPLKQRQINIYKGLANSPAAIQAYMGMAKALGSAKLGKKEQEVIQLAIAEAQGCHYCLAAHTDVGRRFKLTEEQMLGARRGHIEDDPKLNAVARFALSMHEKRGFVSDAEIAEIRKHGYGDPEIAEMVASYALMIYTSTFNHVNDTVVDFPEPPAL